MDVWYTQAPLIFTGLSVAFSFRTGVFNIGAEGQFVIGGLVACILGITLKASGWDPRRWYVWWQQPGRRLHLVPDRRRSESKDAAFTRCCPSLCLTGSHSIYPTMLVNLPLIHRERAARQPGILQLLQGSCCLPECMQQSTWIVMQRTLGHRSCDHCSHRDLDHY